MTWSIIIAVISIAPYLNDKDEHTALYKINSNLYVKTSKIINYKVMVIIKFNIVIVIS